MELLSRTNLKTCSIRSFILSTSAAISRRNSATCFSADKTLPQMSIALTDLCETTTSEVLWLPAKNVFCFLACNSTTRLSRWKQMSVNPSNVAGAGLALDMSNANRAFSRFHLRNRCEPSTYPHSHWLHPITHKEFDEFKMLRRCLKWWSEAVLLRYSQKYRRREGQSRLITRLQPKLLSSFWGVDIENVLDRLYCTSIGGRKMGNMTDIEKMLKTSISIVTRHRTTDKNRSVLTKLL